MAHLRYLYYARERKIVQRAVGYTVQQRGADKNWERRLEAGATRDRSPSTPLGTSKGRTFDEIATSEEVVMANVCATVRLEFVRGAGI